MARKFGHRGFTIIELLVTITIIMLFFTFAYSNYSGFQNRQTLLNSGLTIKNTLRDVQSRAYSNELDCSPGKCNCTLDDTPLSASWSYNFSNRTIFGTCNSVSAIITINPTGISYDEKIVISPFLTPPSQTLSFTNNPPASDTTGTICIGKSDLPGLFFPIDINSSGFISDRSGLTETCP